MKKKQLLFINGHLNTGGVEKSLVDILIHLDYNRYDVDLLLTESLGDYAHLLPNQVNVILRSFEGTYGSFGAVVRNSIRNRDWFSLKMKLIFLSMRIFGMSKIAYAKKLLTDRKYYDCVIGFRKGICTQIAAYAVNAKRRITWWHHGLVNVEKKAYLKEVSRCDHIVAVSDACRNMLIEKMPTLESRIVMIHNMLDDKIIKERAKLFDPCFNASKFHIVSVGGLFRIKRFANAIYAAKQLKDQGIDFEWHLIGDGADREEFKRLANELDVEDVFIFEGNQVNPYPYIYHADLFVHPSYVESFGIVVAEALTLGRACVVTKSAGVMEFLVDGENAVLTEQNADDLSAKVLEVIKNTDLRTKLHNAAKVPPLLLPNLVSKNIDNLLSQI